MKVVQELAIGNLKAYGNPQLIIYRRQSKCVVRKPDLISCYANGMRSSKALMSNVCHCNRMLIQMHSPREQLPCFFYPTHPGKYGSSPKIYIAMIRHLKMYLLCP